MKRAISILLILITALTLPVTALAEGEGGNSLRTSSFAPAVSMSEYRYLFTEAEQMGLSAQLNKAMTAVILARIARVSEEAPANPACGDIDANAWYAFGAQWAVEKGVLPVEDDGLFHPERALDRESLCIALEAYLKAAGRTVNAINSPYAFFDGAGFAHNGRQAAALMQKAGVMIEATDSNFYPGYALTVSQAEPIFLRFISAMRNSIFADLPVSTVTESEPVDPSWFDDACFIGHSQVVGMSQYFNLSKADYYCAVGYKAQNILDDYVLGPKGNYVTLKRALPNVAGKYNKVFIMLGINDCGDADDRIDQFLRPMRQILDLVKETQPNAKIYLISLAPVGRDIHMTVIYNPENCLLYSQALKQLSREYDTEYLDLFRYMSDEEGYLLDEFNSGDGLHFVPKQYALIEDFIRRHTGT